MRVNRRRRMQLGTVAAIAAAAACAFLVPAARSQAGSGSNYTDPTGDNGSAADVTGVSVMSDKASGQVLFRITGTSLAIGANQDVEVWIDSDANPVTGDVGVFGADYWFGVDEGGYGFQHFDGTDWVDTPFATVRVNGGGSSLLVSVNKSELGNTSDFNFRVSAWDDATKQVDRSPDLGTYNYSIDAGGPLISSVSVTTRPQLGPKAGKPFVLTPVGLKLPSDGSLISILPPPDSYSCRATLKGARLAGTGTGGCRFALTKKARGKPLAVVLTVNYQGATLVLSPFRFTVG